MRRFGTLLLASALAAGSLAGCAKKDDAAGQAPAGQTPAGQTAKPGEASQAANDLSEKMSITLMSNSFAGGGWSDDNPMVKMLDDKFNIDLKIDWVPDANYLEKLNVMAASNQFPDVYHISAAQFDLWKDKGIFMDVKPSLDNYANLTKYLPKDNLQVLSPPGKYLGLPFYTPDTRDALMVRKDWLDKLGLSMPTTLDQFYDVAKAFATGDPDGDGKANTAGFSMWVNPNNQNFRDVEFAMGGFGLGNNWKESGGQLVPYQTQTKELKDFASFMAKAYQDGALDRDFALNKTNDTLTKFEQGKIGFAMVNPNNLYDKVLPALKKNAPKAEIVQVVPPAGPTGLQATSTFPGIDKVVINAKIDPKKQQRILTLLDYMLSDEGWDVLRNGIEGTDYKKNADGTYAKLPAVDTDRPDLLESWFFRRFDPTIGMRKWDDPAQDAAITKLFETNAKYRWGNPALGLDSDTMNKQEINLDKDFDAALIKVIYGKSPVDSVDQAVAAWKSGGGDKIIQEINASYQKTKS